LRTKREILTTISSAVPQALIATGFNSDFYSVVATLIPVPFIALAVRNFLGDSSETTCPN
jgi:hypothetical protein